MENIQMELMEKGTITVAFMVYEDFELYSSGVYQHVKGDWLIGWDVMRHDVIDVMWFDKMSLMRCDVIDAMWFDKMYLM